MKIKQVDSRIGIFTLGHSNHSWDEFVGILKSWRIHAIVDVRRYPNSQKFPQFNQGILRKELQKLGIVYFWMGDLLGAFRTEGYEMYMETGEYQKGIHQTAELGVRSRTCLLCSEKKFTGCHRMHIANSLTESGFKVIHIQDEEKSVSHEDAIQLLGLDQSTQMELF